MSSRYARTPTQPLIIGKPILRVPVARLEFALLDPELRRHLGIVAAHLLDEALGVPGQPLTPPTRNYRGARERRGRAASRTPSRAVDPVTERVVVTLPAR